MTRPHGTTISIDYPTGEHARRIARSVGQEVGEIDGDRAETTIDRDGASVVIDIQADDLVALRAAGNTWLSLVQVAERTAEIGAVGDR